MNATCSCYYDRCCCSRGVRTHWPGCCTGPSRNLRVGVGTLAQITTSKQSSQSAISFFRVLCSSSGPGQTGRTGRGMAQPTLAWKSREGTNFWCFTATRTTTATMMPLRSRPNRFVGTAIANLCLLVAILTSSSVSAQDWLGCVNPPGGSGTDLVRVGEPTTICLNLGPNTHWSQGVDYIRYTFQPEADEYSKFHIPNCT